ncbi:hypothetical protein LB505_011477 [Fusarium chuoi]|nr:hypothetical protein LB505_011477 [Fusarium chuoi]
MILNRFQGALKRSVRAFIKLRSISNLATRSWAFVHNGLASALLLSFIRQGSDAQDQDSQEILAELVKTSLQRTRKLLGRFKLYNDRQRMKSDAKVRIYRTSITQ